MVFKSVSDKGALLKPQGILNVLFCSLEVKYVNRSMFVDR